MTHFHWHPKTPTSHRCKWEGYTLEAWTDGRWLVYTPSREVNRSWPEQVLGSDMQDAKRRAQAAAMVLYQLDEAP
jgi:hypothetical protein